MCVINHGCANGSVGCSDNARCRMCLHHFYPSVITCDSNDLRQLNIGAAPTVCLSQHAVENELHKENVNLPRIVVSPEDLQHVQKYEMKIANENNADVVATVTLTRESRNKKRSYQKTQAEETKEMAYVKQNAIVNLNLFRKSIHIGMTNC